ncbi:MAG: hypothetical protein MUE68_02315 [Bacteroidetes bacterium]|jgi:hypothetical protein|nr:hypothetical protein [Bacteroidota bacterium]
MARTLILLAISALILQPTSALPKFASRTGASCQSCHVNPAGKGMRNEFGRMYGMDDIALPIWKDGSDLDEFSVALSPNIDIGMDVRALLFYDQRTRSSSALMMQGDLYLDLRLNKKVRFYLDKGLYNGFEAFALARVLPSDGYVKVGKFTPAYGTRTDDHNAFIRGGPFGGGAFIGPYASLSSTGYASGLLFGERSEDTGLELGVAPAGFTLTAGVFNGAPGPGLNGVTGTRQKAIALRGDARFKLSTANVMVGGSIYRGPVGGSTHLYRGVFGAVTVADRYTWNTEVDHVLIEHPGTDRAGLIFWNELNILLTPGIDMKLGYEFYDPDTDLKNGGFSRAVVGAELFLLSGVELRPLYRINLEDPTELQNNEFQVMIHLYL